MSSNFSMSQGFSIFGKLTTYFGTFIVTIVCYIFFYLGYKAVTTVDVHSQKTTGTITEADCNYVAPIDSRSSPMYNCSLKVAYNVNGTQYNSIINISSSTNYVKNAAISIKYDPSNPSDVLIDGISSKTIGWITIVISAIILIMTWIWTYFVATDSSFSSVVGGVNAVSLLSRH